MCTVPSGEPHAPACGKALSVHIASGMRPCWASWRALSCFTQTGIPVAWHCATTLRSQGRAIGRWRVGIARYLAVPTRARVRSVVWHGGTARRRWKRPCTWPILSACGTSRLVPAWPRPHRLDSGRSVCAACDSKEKRTALTLWIGAGDSSHLAPAELRIACRDSRARVRRSRLAV